MESFHLDARREVKILVRRAGFLDEKTQVYEVIPPQLGEELWK